MTVIETASLTEKILKLKREKNALILAHNCQLGNVQDIAYMRLHDGRVGLETLMGEEKVVPGRVIEVDFVSSTILLDEPREPDKSS